ncbi:hypothetical protein P0W64_19520 [Tsukamurella sp. 8F]|uniref:hypothetical protein n=1 Tax=unclassified Tsukamurella TaxID=2633480 RepID=UPI0023B95E6E|nr:MULTISPECIES: hypothetical protein [unclassified Tsukamurella]MDF0531731.1 hypothetical protein [Tsukamurella sp. 8J]MDF0588977.1 hypothetical protein [Tsukamurella sp. 8F]
MTNPESAAPPVQHEWVAGPGDAARIALTATMATVRRPALVVVAVVWLLYIVIRAVAVGPDVWLIGILLPLIPVAITYFLVYRNLRASMGPGAQWVSGFGEESMLIGGPLGRSVLPYRSLSGIRVGGRLVFLTVRPRGRLGFPAALFPPDAVAHVRARIDD